MIKFKTKTVKSILDPVLQQIESLVLIGDYIEKGHQIPNLTQSIANIADSTMNLVNVINKTLSKTDDQVLVKDLKEFLVQITESVDKLKISSKLLEDGKNKEGTESLITGANGNIYLYKGVINNVIYILNSYDDSQIRKIEKFLSKIKTELEQIIVWNYQNLVQIAENMQNELVGAVRLLNTRIPEIIDPKLGERIAFANNDLKDQMEKFIMGLNKVFETDGKSENSLYCDKSSIQKFQVYKTTVTLLSLLWMESLENDEIEIFYKSIPCFTSSFKTWLTAQSNQNYRDIYGKYIADYILNSIDVFMGYNNFNSKNIPVYSLRAKRLLIELSELLSKNAKPSQTLCSDLMQQIELIKAEFMEAYNEWIKMDSQSTKLANVMCSDISSNTNYDEWKTNIKSICESAHHLCEISSNVKPDEDLITILSDLLKYSNIDSSEDFKNQTEKYHQVNNLTTKLQNLIHQLCCDKNLYTNLQVIESGEEFKLRINECPDEGKGCQDSLLKAEMSLSILEKNIDSLQKITLYTINSHPMPMSSVYQIEKSLEKMYFNRNLLRQMVSELKKSPENHELKQHIIDLTDETISESRKVELIIIQHTDIDNLMKYAKSCCIFDSNLKAIVSDTSVPLSSSQISQLKSILEEIQVKMIKENDACTDPKIQEFRDHNLQAIQMAYKDVCNGINPSEHFSKVKSIQEIENKEAEQVQEKIQELRILEIEKPEEHEIPPPVYVIPEKYIKANEVIQKHDATDRLAVAASELHKQVKLENIQDSSISKSALDISYMFADFSTLFRFEYF